MNKELLKAMVQSLVRSGAIYFAGRLTSYGVWSQGEGTAYAIGITALVCSVIWSLWDKWSTDVRHKWLVSLVWDSDQPVPVDVEKGIRGQR